MSPSTWIVIYMPLFIILFVIIPQQREMHKAALLKMKKRKGVKTMTNEVIKKYIGMNCKISTGSFGTNVVGKIVDVNENWLEVETKKGKELINADFVQNIKVK
ncbi:MAG: DUF6897 domain-containing protein [Desulfitobacteriaceae bacterium]